MARRCIIVSKKSPGKCLHTDGGNTGNGTKVQLWDICKDCPQQEWLWDGTLLRSAKSPNKCLHSDGGNTGNGTKIQLWDVCENCPQQEWTYDGRNIRSRKNPSACWHLEGGRTGNGTKIHLWNTHDHTNGSWELRMLKDRVKPAAKPVEIRPVLEFMYGYDNASPESVNQTVTDVEGFMSQMEDKKATKNTSAQALEVAAKYGFPTGFEVSAKASASSSHEVSYGSTNSTKLSRTRTKETVFKFPGKTKTDFYRWAITVKGGEIIALPGAVVIFSNNLSRTGKTKEELEKLAPPVVLRALA